MNVRWIFKDGKIEILILFTEIINIIIYKNNKNNKYKYKYNDWLKIYITNNDG
jgi:hypothetical protein